jgi:hypothetical protein
MASTNPFDVLDQSSDEDAPRDKFMVAKGRLGKIVARRQQAAIENTAGSALSSRNATYDLESALLDIADTIDAEEQREVEAKLLESGSAAAAAAQGGVNKLAFSFDDMEHAVDGAAGPSGSRAPGQKSTWDFSQLEHVTNVTQKTAAEEHAAAIAAAHAADPKEHLERQVRKGKAKTRQQNKRKKDGSSMGEVVNDRLAAKLKKRSNALQRKRRAAKVY